MSQSYIVSYTKPIVDGIETMDDFIVYTARVSNPDNQKNFSTGGNLLNYCFNHGHFSIFEVASITFCIETTRAIGRQLLRHRSFSFQEFSQRYANPSDHLGFEIQEARLQDNKNRQNSIKLDSSSEENDELSKWWMETQKYHILVAQRDYEEALKKGIAKEQSRSILPEGLTMTRMYMTGSVRSWLHYVDLRAKKGTQEEHRQIALDIAHQICLVAPSLENIIEKMLHEHER